MDDKKCATMCYVALSLVLTITASMLICVGLIAMWTIDTDLFPGLLLLSEICLFLSIGVGGVGISRIAELGWNGKWSLVVSNHDFFYQALWGYAGLVLLIAGVFMHRI